MQSIERFAQSEGADLAAFEKGQRKEEVARERLADFRAEEGVLLIGTAQEKAGVIRTEKRRNPQTGAAKAGVAIAVLVGLTGTLACDLPAEELLKSDSKGVAIRPGMDTTVTGILPRSARRA